MDRPPEALFHGEGLSMDVRMDKFGAVAVAVLLSATLALGASTSSEKPSTNPTAKLQNTSHHAHHASKKSRKGRVRGQKAIDGDRVRQIQEALIREHYLKGEPSGKWDAATQQALHRYQSDQGWQSKTVPDSRALKFAGGRESFFSIDVNNEQLNARQFSTTFGARGEHV
jgi:hypothetical protein